MPRRSLCRRAKWKGCGRRPRSQLPWLRRDKETFQADYPIKSLKFDYGFDKDKKPFMVSAIYHDDKFTYIRSLPQEKPTLYEVKDGSPNLINFDLKRRRLCRAQDPRLRISRDRQAQHGFQKAGVMPCRKPMKLRILGAQCPGQAEACSRRAAQECSDLGRDGTDRGDHAHALGLGPGERREIIAKTGRLQRPKRSWTQPCRNRVPS